MLNNFFLKDVSYNHGMQAIASPLIDDMLLALNARETLGPI